MNILKINIRTFTQFFYIILISVFLNQCGIYKKSDARKVPVNANDRVQKNLEEGRRIKFGNLGKGGSGKFQFASSNEMWRATIEILDFVPLINVDYGGGIIVTDWYSDSSSKNESIKIMVQFLTNEIRSDAIKVNIYKKKCLAESNCQTQVLKTRLTSEIKLAILKKAAFKKKESLENK